MGKTLERILNGIRIGMMGLALLAPFGCKTEEPKPEVLATISLSPPKPVKPPKRDLKKEIETIIKENEIKYIDKVFVYHGTDNKEFYEELGRRFNYSDQKLDEAWYLIEANKDCCPVVALLPREEIGKKKGCVLGVFPAIYKLLQTEEDLESCIADYVAFKARIQAEGMSICGDVINQEKVKEMHELVYERIIELLARVYQIDQIQKHKKKVSKEYKKLIGGALFHNYLNLLFYGISGNKYAREVISGINEHWGIKFEFKNK